MHKAGDTGDFGIVSKLFLEPVFDRFDIVIGARFDLFYRFRVDDRKVAYHRVELLHRGR